MIRSKEWIDVAEELPTNSSLVFFWVKEDSSIRKGYFFDNDTYPWFTELDAREDYGLEEVACWRNYNYQTDKVKDE